jgi:hypothetical protein
VPGRAGALGNLGGGDDSIVEDAGGVDTEFSGEAGNDTLTGGPNDNVLSGGPGDDNLSGNAGRDTLEGGPGSDTESGGAGDDRLGGANGTRAPLDTGADSFDGGLGTDLLFTADGQNDRFISCSPQPDPAFDFAGVDLLDLRVRNCDLIQRAAKDQHPTVQLRARTVRVRAGRAAVRLECPRRAPGRRCDGTAEIVKSGRVVARGSYRLRSGQTRTLRLRLRRRASGRAELRTRGERHAGSARDHASEHPARALRRSGGAAGSPTDHQRCRNPLTPTTVRRDPTSGARPVVSWER